MIGLVLVTHGRLAVEFRCRAGTRRRPAEPDRDHHHRSRRRRGAAPQGHHRSGQARRHRRRRRHPHRHVRRHARPISRSPSWSRPKVEVLAGINLPMLVKLANVRDALAARRSRRRRAGSRPQIHHHRQPRPGQGNDRDCSRRTRNRRPASALRSLVTRDRQQEGPARPRLGQVRAARPSSSTPTSRVTRKGQEVVGGTSIMGLMMLAAGAGTSITVGHGQRSRPRRSTRLAA